MKQIGIAVDNYKFDRFKEELTEAGYKDITKTAHSTHTLIKIRVKDIDFEAHKIKIAAICLKLETYFKNNKQKS